MKNLKETSKNKISLCMIIKDEEKYLENCLNSIKDLVDETIIVDTGSKDKSKEIAKKFTDKIFDFKWNDNFSDARNFCISKATKDWILSLDADEIISKKDQDKIKKLIKENKADVFIFDWRDYTNNLGVDEWISCKGDEYKESKKALGFYVSDVLKFFKNKKGYFFDGRIHETPHNSIKKFGGRIFKANIVIHHYGSLDKEKFANKKEKYIDLLKERLEKKEFKEKSEDYLCFELAKELTNLKKYKEAITFLERAIKVHKESEYLTKYLPALGALYILEERLDEAEATLKKSLIIDSKNFTAHLNLGAVYLRKKQDNNAILEFKKAIILNPNFADAYFNLGLVYKIHGKNEIKDKFFNKAIELNLLYKEKIESLK